ncbi:hypothetical protein ACET8U_14305 [Aeromonas veronii]
MIHISRNMTSTLKSYLLHYDNFFAVPPEVTAPEVAPKAVTTAFPPAIPNPPLARLPPPNAANPADEAAAPLKVPPAAPSPAALAIAPIVGARTRAAPPVTAVAATTAIDLNGFSQIKSKRSSNINNLICLCVHCVPCDKKCYTNTKKNQYDKKLSECDFFKKTK